MGYNEPVQDHLFVDGEDPSRLILNISFASPFQIAAVDQLEVRVVLPEFASDIRWAVPFDIDSEARDTLVTYLVSGGRPVLVLRKANVCKYHNQNFQVSYRYGSLLNMHQPALLIVGFFAFFALCALAVRLDLSISPKTNRISLRSRRAGKAGDVVNKICKLQEPLTTAYDQQRQLRQALDGDKSLASKGATGETATDQGEEKAPEHDKEKERAVRAPDERFAEFRSHLEELRKLPEVATDAQFLSCLKRLETAQTLLRAAARRYARAAADDLDEAIKQYAKAVETVEELVNELALL